jgi:hypothetical protein
MNGMRFEVESDRLRLGRGAGWEGNYELGIRNGSKGRAIGKFTS